MKIPTTYTDKFGSVETEIQNDNGQLMLNINGTRFISRFFDDFEIENKNEIPVRFSLSSFNKLTNCQLICKIPILLLRNGKDFEAILYLELNLKETTPRQYQRFAVFSINVDNKEIRSNETGLFEGGLEAIKRELPDEYKLRCCYGCAFSDYSVFGQGFFGTMLCFKNIKESYLKVQNKDEYMDIMDDHDSLVQETHLCNEFKERHSGTGYRG